MNLQEAWNEVARIVGCNPESLEGVVRAVRASESAARELDIARRTAKTCAKQKYTAENALRLISTISTYRGDPSNENYLAHLEGNLSAIHAIAADITDIPF